MRQVPVHLLNALVVFGESKNIDEAAAVLGLTQPALSKQLKLLEGYFDQPLFRISGRKKVLTVLGRDLHQRMKNRFGNLNELIQLTSLQHASGEHANIRIVGRRGVLDRISGKAWFPGFVEFSEASNEQVIRDLTELKAEMGVAHSCPNSQDWIARPLFVEKFQIAMPKKFHVIETRFGRALFGELLEHPCVGFKADDELLNHLCQAYSVSLARLKMSRATADYTSIARMVEAGFGWAVLPAYVELDLSRVRRVSIPEGILTLRRFYLIYRKELSRLPWFKNWVSEVLACFRDG